MPRLGVPSPTDAATRLPPDARDGSGPLASIDHSPAKKIDLNALSRLSLHAILTRKKGRKEGSFMATELTEGSKAPAFKLPRDGGGTVSLADFKGRKLVILRLPAGRHPRLHPRIHRFLHASRPIPEGGDGYPGCIR